jgi:hypothetical protein
MDKSKWIIAVAFGVCTYVQASTIPEDELPCVSASLSTYIALGTMGCSVGRLQFRDFEFSVITSGGGAVPVTPANVNVTPLPASNQAGVNIASSGFNVMGSQFVQYLLTYTIDPGPPIIDGDDMSLFTQTPVFPGLASITSVKCVGAAFVEGACQGNVVTENVFHNGTTFSLTAHATFTPTDIVGVQTTIDLEANGASANFSSFSDSANETPEPASAILVCAAMALGLPGAKRLLARRSILKSGQVGFKFFS